MSDAAEHIGGIVAGDVVVGIDVAEPRAAVLPIIRFTLGGGGGGGNYLPGPNVESARCRRRLISRRSQRTMLVPPRFMLMQQRFSTGSTDVSYVEKTECKEERE